MDSIIEYQERTRRIVCAANRLKSGLVVCGARHFDTFMRNQIEAANETHAHAEQGFIDQYGHFYTREEAWLIARKNNQIIRLVGNQAGKNIEIVNSDKDIPETAELYSENLY